ncbi:peptide ABC transporter ATP-binding protein [Platysternon megacephalum]|uniref:Peptide ABC transporter ATP-binding protein n=1 Tax=Platysternon megacephalum TaxID=55544 RepID=A0A4D9DGL8_9SAUR|nr:peptide ABC transporter ATP-binding protein [Platysternon megacephalum]
MLIPRAAIGGGTMSGSRLRWEALRPARLDSHRGDVPGARLGSNPGRVLAPPGDTAVAVSGSTSHWGLWQTHFATPDTRARNPRPPCKGANTRPLGSGLSGTRLLVAASSRRQP